MMTFEKRSGSAGLIADRRSGLRHERRVLIVDKPAEDEPVEAGGERRKVERDYSNEEVEFMSAMDDYKRRSGRQFPTRSEVLEVLRAMGYRKVAEPTEIEL